MKKLVLSFFVVSVVNFGSYAQSAEEKGLAIAKQADEADKGFESSTVSLKMILTNKHGQESERLLENKTLELHNDGDKSLIVFNSPKDVEGTSTLTFTHKASADDQWLYLPSLKRVKRISSDNKSGPFMGSEFAYEDLSSQEVEKYNYKFIKEENVNGQATYVIERYPLDPKSGYVKQVVWYNKENLRLEKIDFYDRKNALMKTLTYHNYKLYLNKHWRASEMEMENHLTGKATKLLFDNYKFKTGLDDQDFSQNSLVRAGG
ncbi:MAG TPA: outer membrane lipoprotein-sorting protein [Cyclobacteriaceae bacterium]|nr:outer membrane lipoprotein-sorting protein [Cyclobacteriaceae bacterium]